MKLIFSMSKPPQCLPFVFEAGSTDPATQTVVWLHGGTLSHHEFTQVLGNFSRDKYRHILLDLPGHGVLALEDFKLEKARQNLEFAIRRYVHNERKCHIVGFSLGGVTALSLLQQKPEFIGTHVAKIFLSSLRLEPPVFATLLLVIAVLLVRIFVLLYSIEAAKMYLEKRLGMNLSEALVNDMRKWASLGRILRASENTPQPELIIDNMTERVDVSLMLCTGSKESVAKLVDVKNKLKRKFRSCRSVVALDQRHL